MEITDYDLDHKTPIARKGPDVKKNIVLACKRCNKEKHNKTLQEFREWK